MKKQNLFIIVAALAGLLLGYLIFNQPSEHDHEQEEAQAGVEWTCSMHPQIRQPEPGSCPLCGMALIPAAENGEGVNPDEIRLTDNAMALSNIQTVSLSDLNSGESKLRLSGMVKENQENNAVLSAYFSGRVEAVAVNFAGEKVNSGQVVARLYSPELVAAQQELLTAAGLKNAQPELYKAVRNKLKFWKLNDAQIDQIEKNGKIQETYPLYASTGGVITQLMVEQGDYVKQGQPLMKVADLSKIWLEFDAYESQISNLRKGMPLEITAEAIPGTKFTSEISFIDPVLNEKTRTIKVRAVVNNKELLLKPGMFASAEIQTSGKAKGEAVLMIPASSVLWTGERSLVYVQTRPGEPVFQAKEIQTGIKSGDFYQVLHGLSPQDRVVVNGAFTIDAAAQLQGKPSMMNPAENKEQEMSMTEMEPREKEYPQLKKAIGDLVSEYLKLKNDLASDSFETSAAFFEQFNRNLSQIEVRELTTKDSEFWKEQSSKLFQAMRKVENAKDITERRAAFKPFSEALIALISHFGTSGKLYKQYCPMADQNQGGYWISDREKIENPYFGSAMHSCGEVTSVLE